MGTWAEKRQKELGITNGRAAEVDLGVIDKALAAAGINDEQIANTARGAFITARRGILCRGIEGMVSAEQQAERIIRQVAVLEARRRAFEEKFNTR